MHQHDSGIAVSVVTIGVITAGGLAVVAAALYVLAVNRLRRRGDGWP
ncbi:MAG: hypothetical protein K0R68_3801, partial [Mycobacterium sp.]|nr:hypothetical protein [Mycobacterium sp.]